MRIKLTYGSMQRESSGVEFWLKGARVEWLCGNPLFHERGHDYRKCTYKVGMTDCHGPYDEIRVPSNYRFKKGGIPSWLGEKVPKLAAKAFGVGVRVRVLDVRHGKHAWATCRTPYIGREFTITTEEGVRRWSGFDFCYWWHEDWLEIVD